MACGAPLAAERPAGREERKVVTVFFADLVGFTGRAEQLDPEDVRAWRTHLQQFGVWANDPVPMFPYPGSPDYRRLWGLPDDDAWERALDWYLDRHPAFSDIQEARPQRLSELELT